MTHSHTAAVAGALIAALASAGAAPQAPSVESQEPPTRPVIATNRAFCENLQGPVVRIASKLTPEGIRVRISPPERPRYPDAAPVVVHSAATPSIDRVNACVKDRGFVEVTWECTSRGAVGSLTCAETLADVLAFATGNTRSIDDRSIGAYTGDLKIAPGNVGLIGWSAGGNRAIITMARHGDRFPGLRWYASWESPVLSPVDGGWGSVFQPNRFYDPSTGTVDFSRLRYSAEMPLWIWLPSGVAREPSFPRGGLYLDGDNNGRFNRDADYGFWVSYGVPPPGRPRKAFYTPAVIRAARDREVFGRAWPAHIATVDEVDDQAASELPLPYVKEVVRRFPALSVVIFESEVGHVTAAADHPHAIAQVNAWLDAGSRWVRFNPDTHYVTEAMQRPPSRRVQNAAGIRLDRQNIRGRLLAEEKDGGPTDGQAMAAAVAELADRTRMNNWTAELSLVLVKYE